MISILKGNVLADNYGEIMHVGIQQKYDRSFISYCDVSVFRAWYHWFLRSKCDLAVYCKKGVRLSPMIFWNKLFVIGSLRFTQFKK